MPKLRIGARLRSQVDGTQVIVIRAPADDLDLRIGGQPVIDVLAEPAAGLAMDPALSGGNLMGKRYTREEGDVEILVTRAGEATISLAEVPLVEKAGQPLPASD